MPKYNIQRQNKGKRKTRFGIILDLLSPRHQQHLLKNELLKEHSNDDNFLTIAFKIEDEFLNNIQYSKLFLDPHSEEVINAVQLRKNLKLVKWSCAYCRDEIHSLMDDYTAENFTCEKCYDKYLKNSKWIPELVLENSLAFTSHCKKILRKEQSDFIKYIKDGKR